MKRLAGLMVIAVVAVWLSGCAGCEPNECDTPNPCDQPNPNDCNPEEPNSCDSSPYGMTPTVPSFQEGGQGWR